MSTQQSQNDDLREALLCLCVCRPQCIDQLTVAQAELQDSVKELTKSRKKYQEAETMAQAVREKAELDAKYDPVHYFRPAHLRVRHVTPPRLSWLLSNSLSSFLTVKHKHL